MKSGGDGNERFSSTCWTLNGDHADLRPHQEFHCKTLPRVPGRYVVQLAVVVLQTLKSLIKGVVDSNRRMTRTFQRFQRYKLPRIDRRVNAGQVSLIEKLVPRQQKARESLFDQCNAPVLDDDLGVPPYTPELRSHTPGL